jgi:hypothetical protein
MWTTRATAFAVYRNRRRIRGARGQRLLRLRGERLERQGMRRVHLRGHSNIRKRLLIHTGGFNLGLLLRQLIGVGTPRGLQGRLIAVMITLLALIRSVCNRLTDHRRPLRPDLPITRHAIADSVAIPIRMGDMVFTTGC